MLSVGLSRSRWRATVSSTSPSGLPRWPPVLATVSMIAVRISAQSWTSSTSLRRLRSAGPEIVARIDNAAGSLCGWRRDSSRVAAGRPGLSPLGRVVGGEVQRAQCAAGLLEQALDAQLGVAEEARTVVVEGDATLVEDDRRFERQGGRLQPPDHPLQLREGGGEGHRP